LRRAAKRIKKAAVVPYWPLAATSGATNWPPPAARLAASSRQWPISDIGYWVLVLAASTGRHWQHHVALLATGYWAPPERHH
jgi:hypothetical protein